MLRRVQCQRGKIRFTIGMMTGTNKMSKPHFDDSYRSGATHLDVSISDRSTFDGDDFFGARNKLTRSCLIVKTQQDSLRQLPTSELKSSIRSTTSSTVSFDKITLRSYDGEYCSPENSSYYFWQDSLILLIPALIFFDCSHRHR